MQIYKYVTLALSNAQTIRIRITNDTSVAMISFVRLRGECFRLLLKISRNKSGRDRENRVFTTYLDAARFKSPNTCELHMK